MKNLEVKIALKSKIKLIEKTIENGMLEIEKYLIYDLPFDNFSSGLVKEFYLVKSWYSNIGKKIMKKLIQEIDKEKVDEEIFKIFYLTLTNQFLYLNNLLNKELDENYIEIFLRYIKELPFNLAFDLGLKL